MFGKKKENKRPKSSPRPPGSLAQYGIFEIPESIGDLGGNLNNDDDDDEDLEAELLALTSENGSRPKPHRKAPPKPNLDALIAESMKDVPDDEVSSGDENDPDLLNELMQITGNESLPEKVNENKLQNNFNKNESNNVNNETISLLTNRLSMYKIAEEKANFENDTRKAKRFKRGIETLNQLISASQSGKAVNPDEIPPELPPSAIKTTVASNVADSITPPEPVAAAEPKSEPEVGNDLINFDSSPEQKVVEINQEKLDALLNRQKDYKKAAVLWKRSGHTEMATQYLRIAKQFDVVINSVKQGEDINLSEIPPIPTLPSTAVAEENVPATNKEEIEIQGKAEDEIKDSEPSAVPIKSDQSLESALKERLEVYRRSKTAAENEGNSSKVRRYNRICKQFESALQLHCKGKPIPLDELPTPPGFAPLVNAEPTPMQPPVSKPQNLPHKAPNNEETSPENVTDETTPDKTAPTPPPRQNSDKKKQRITSRADKQAQQLQKRQQELKIAALKAKKDGDIELAKDYLRQAKGIDPLINASLSGLPVDMSSIPLSPAAKLQLDKRSLSSKSVTSDGFTVISSLDCSEEATGTDQQIYENLEAQLTKQIQWCLTTRDHCKEMGDVSSYNKWGRLTLDYTKDLDMLRVRKRDSLPPPQHHYETKTYSIVQCCTDLTDSDIEITILRGINYAKEADTYVIYEFPLPNDAPSTDRTSTIRETNNPEYNAKFSLSGLIDRKSRPCLRVFKRHGLKCQVWSKGCSLNPILCCTHPRGFFRSDSLLGTVTVKLQPLETSCILHDSFPLMDGRKTAGGKLEVKIRLRNPILTKQIEQNTDKWLAIDH